MWPFVSASFTLNGDFEDLCHRPCRLSFLLVSESESVSWGVRVPFGLSTHPWMGVGFRPPSACCELVLWCTWACRLLSEPHQRFPPTISFPTGPKSPFRGQTGVLTLFLRPLVASLASQDKCKRHQHGLQGPVSSGPCAPCAVPVCFPRSVRGGPQPSLVPAAWGAPTASGQPPTLSDSSPSSSLLFTLPIPTRIPLSRVAFIDPCPLD